MHTIEKSATVSRITLPQWNEPHAVWHVRDLFDGIASKRKTATLFDNLYFHIWRPAPKPSQWIAVHQTLEAFS
jgi:hypothetical protein